MCPAKGRALILVSITYKLLRFPTLIFCLNHSDAPIINYKFIAYVSAFKYIYINDYYQSAHSRLNPII